MFALEGWLLRGPFFRLVVLAGMLCGIAVTCGTVAWLVSTIETWYEGVWWAFLHLSDSGYLGDDEGFGLRVVGTITTVLGVVVFVGTLIAVMTQWLLEIMERVESGRTPVSTRNHVVVLGWTTRTPVVIRELLSAGDRVSRFLALRGIRSVRVVLLVDAPVPFVIQELTERLGPLWDPRAVTVRAGSALRPRHLSRAGFADAAVVLVPAGAVGGESEIDARTIKTLMSANLAMSDRDPAEWPLIVAEMVASDKASLAQRAYAGPVEVVTSDVIVSRIVAQILRHPGVADAYTELLGHEEGSELYVQPCPPVLVGRPFDSAAAVFPNAVPVGVLHNDHDGERHVSLLPPSDAILHENDELVLVAESFHSSAPIPEEMVRWANAVTFVQPDAEVRMPGRILILGWSRKVPDLLGELSTYRHMEPEIHILSIVPEGERARAIRAAGVSLAGMTVVHHEGDFVSSFDLHAVNPASFDRVALLASDWIVSDHEADARTLLGHMVLREELEREELGRGDDACASGPNVVVELLDAANQALFGGWTGDVIVSSVVVSRMVAHVGLRPRLRAVYEALFSVGGAEFFVRPVEQFGISDDPVSGDELRQKARASGEILIGFRRGDAGGGETSLNPGHSERFTFEAGDALITLGRAH